MTKAAKKNAKRREKNKKAAEESAVSRNSVLGHAKNDQAESSSAGAKRPSAVGRDGMPPIVDLHGLHIEEATEFVQKCIRALENEQFSGYST